MASLHRILAGWALALTLTLPARAQEDDEQEPPPPPTSCPDRYDVQAKFLSNPDENILIAGVIGWCRQNKTRLVWDERYAQVARKWSEQLIRAGTSPDRLIPVDRLRFELRQAGVTDAAVLPYSIGSAIETLPPELLRFLDQEVIHGRYTHFAVGVWRSRDNTQMITTLLLGRRPTWLEPLPVCPAPGSRLPILLKVLKGYSHPRWLLATPKGAVLAETLLYEDGVWQGTLPLDSGRGIYQLELVVQGPTGPEVAALFPMYVGVPRPSLPTVKVYPAPTRYAAPEEAEKALLALVNQARTRLKLPALALDEQLSVVAREHSMDLLGDRHAVHRTTTGALLDRLHKKEVPFARALENVSLSPSPEAAHERFMESPSHRLNVLDPNVNKLGIGIAMERGPEEDILGVTEVFLEPPESGEGTVMADRVLKIINDFRRIKGRFTLGMDPELSRIARRSARRLADLGPRADPGREGRALLQELEEGTLQVPSPRIRYLRTAVFKQVLASPEVLDEEVNRVGIGIAQGASTGGEVWVSLIFAGR